MKKILTVLLTAIMLLSLTACGSNNTNTNESQALDNTEQEETIAEVESDSTEQEETAENVKSDGYEKFSQLKIGMTESEVNAILGEPTKIDKAYYYYNIIVNGKDLELNVWINTASGLVTYISGNFYDGEYRGEFADKATDLSTVDGLENGEINSYDDCVKAFKTSGYLANIDEDGVTQYFWVNDVDGYITVTFKEDGSVKTYSGVC